MAYPPTTPPGDRAPTTPLSGNHDGEHNQIANALDDIITELGASPKGPDASIEARLDRLEAELQPRGSIIMLADDAQPAGDYLLCDGSLVSTTTYAALFALLQYTYGGSGATFALPDMRGRSPVGAGSSTGAALNGTVGQNLGRADTELKQHLHTMPSHFHAAGTLSGSVSIDHQHPQYDVVGTFGTKGQPTGWLADGTPGILFGPPDKLNATYGAFYSRSTADWIQQIIDVDLPNYNVANRTATISGQTETKDPGDTNNAGVSNVSLTNYHPVTTVTFWIRY